MKNIACLIVLVMLNLLTNVQASAAIKDVSEIAKVCMNAESSLQDYLLIGMNITYGDPQNDLVIKLNEIDAFIKDVQQHGLNETLQNEIKEITKLWAKIRPELQNKPNKKSSQLLRTLINNFVKRCEEFDEHLAQSTQLLSSSIIVLVMDMGIEVQQMTVNYLFKVWGIEDKEYKAKVLNHLDRYAQLYQKTLNILEQNQNREVKDKLDLINKNFLVFKFMALPKSGRYVPSIAQKNAHKILTSIIEIIEIEESL